VIIDGLCYLGDSLFGLRAGTGELLAGMDAAGISRAVVVPVKPRDYRLRAASELVADAVRAQPDRLVGLVRVDPWQGADAVAEAERGLDELGLQGIFLHPWEETYRVNAPMVEAVVETARRRRRPVLVATGYPWLSEALQLGDLAARFSDVVFIATNGAQMNISGLGQQDAETALQECSNILVQTAGVYREDFLEGVVKRFGAERLVFASGFPVMDPALEVRRVQWGHFEAEAREKIIGGNLARLFQWEGQGP
jgi:predicted TIM-barrel fold metal-dependent hydrolase